MSCPFFQDYNFPCMKVELKRTVSYTLKKDYIKVSLRRSKKTYVSVGRIRLVKRM